MSARRPALGFIFLTLLLDVLGFGLLIPVSPQLVKQLGGGSEAKAGVAVATLAAIYAGMQFLFAPVLGSLSDRFGRRPVLLVALLGSGLDYFAMALSPTLGLLFLTRALNGISGATITVCNAYVADVTPPHKRAAGFGLMGAAFGLGFVFGPLLGGALAGEDAERIRWPFYAAGALTLMNWVYGLIVLPESLPADRRRPVAWARTNPVGVFAGLGRYPLAAGLAGVLFLFNVAQFGLHVTWVLSMGARFGWGPRDVGVSLAIVGIGSALVQGGLAGRIIRRIGEPAALLTGLLIGAAAFVGYGLATEGWMVYATVAFASLGGIAGPAAQSLITRSVDPREQGEIQGAMAGLTSVAGILGYTLGGSLYGYFVSERAPVYLPGAPFLAGAVLSVIGTLLAVAVLRRHDRAAALPPPDGACPRCGCSLAGSPQAGRARVCPECGAGTSPQDAAA